MSVACGGVEYDGRGPRVVLEMKVPKDRTSTVYKDTIATATATATVTRRSLSDTAMGPISKRGGGAEVDRRFSTDMATTEFSPDEGGITIEPTPAWLHQMRAEAKDLLKLDDKNVTDLEKNEVARGVRLEQYIHYINVCIGAEGRKTELVNGRIIVKVLGTITKFHAAGNAGFSDSCLDMVLTASGDLGRAGLPYRTFRNMDSAAVLSRQEGDLQDGSSTPDALWGCRHRAHPADYPDVFSLASMAYEIAYAYRSVSKLKKYLLGLLAVQNSLINIVVGMKVPYDSTTWPDQFTQCTVLYLDRTMLDPHNIYNSQFLEFRTLMSSPVIEPTVTHPQLPFVQLPFALLYMGAPDPLPSADTLHFFNLQLLIAETYDGFGL